MLHYLVRRICGPRYRHLSRRLAGVLASARLVALLAGCVPSIVVADSWRLSVDEQNGLPTLSRGGNIVLSSAFVFWGRNWQWADQQTDFKVRAPFFYSVLGKNAALAFDLNGRISKLSDRQLAFDFDFDAHQPLSSVIGGGIAFKFDLAALGAELGEPQLLPDNLGWSWGQTAGRRIELRFDHPLAAAYFERGQKSELRAFFYKNEITPGQRHYVATLSVFGDILLSPTTSERFGIDDFTTWPVAVVDSNASPVDLSFLNATEAPAGRHGFLGTQGDRLVFQDGTPARFWGTNLTAYALFLTSSDEVKRQAHRLSQLGFNLVRIHHHDSDWVHPNIFGDENAPSTQHLDPAMLERLDWWIKCLKDEGIYVWLDLHVGRQLKAADGIRAFDEIRHGKSTASLVGYNYVNESIKEAMKSFNEAYLDHQNRFTGLKYKDEPAIAALLITNENDLTNHYGNALLPDKGVPEHSAIYLREAEQFAAAHALPKERTWRAWEDGPSKLFLNDLERRFDVDMIEHLRSIGIKVPLVPTSTWGMNPLSSLPALTVGDLIDVHSYGGVDELGKNPMYAANLLDWMAAAQVVGKPLTVSEWGVDAGGALAPDRQDIPLYVAASASMQGWGAVMFFAYSQEPFSSGGGSPSIYHAYNDPALLASLPAAALLYREQHVHEATTRYVFAPNKEMLFDRSISATDSIALRTAAGRGRLSIALPRVAELPWLTESITPPGATVIRDPHQSLLAPGAAVLTSDSGELKRYWDPGFFTIDTPRTQAAMGWIGGKPVELRDVEVNVKTPNAEIAVQSLDGNDISRSRRLMLSVAAQSIPRTPHSLPFYSRPIEGTIRIAALPGLRIYAWDGREAMLRPIPVRFEKAHYVLALDRSIQSSWLLLSATTPRQRH